MDRETEKLLRRISVTVAAKCVRAVNETLAKPFRLKAKAEVGRWGLMFEQGSRIKKG
jgi:hypothetical protein